MLTMVDDFHHASEKLSVVLLHAVKQLVATLVKEHLFKVYEVKVVINGQYKHISLEPPNF